MSRRFNFTGRKKLKREYFQIRLLQDKPGAPPSFAALVSIPKELGLDSAARVYLEAYVGNSSMRFDFGTVGTISNPHDCVLTELDSNTPILFRVRVVDESQALGRILASANGIRPEGDREGNNRKTILPLRGMDLGEELWRLEVDKDAGPTLAVNNRVPGLVERLPGDAVLMAAIFPEVIRQMVRRLWSGEAGFDETSDWAHEWFTWLKENSGRDLSSERVSDEDDVERLGNDIVTSICDKLKFATKVSDSLGAVL